MPRVTRWFIRSGLVYLIASLALGVTRAWPGGGAWLPAMWPAYVHLLTVGWLTQLIFGVAYWMFPSPPKSGTPGERLAWTSFVLLNTGLVLRLVAEPWSSTAGGWHGAALATSALLQLAGALAFATPLWSRVQGR